jgi:RimJ/RimL family protein N-acetyltransferase
MRSRVKRRRLATIVVNNDNLDSPYRIDRPMTESASVRQLEPHDAEAWALLRREALESHPFAFGSSPPDNQQELVDAAVARLAPSTDSAIFGEFAGTALVGIVGVSRLPGKKERHKAFIWGMYVTASRRRQGVAERLLREAMGLARSWAGVEQLHLSVSEFAPDARRLYAKLGFREWGREPRAICWEGRSADEAHMVFDLRAAAAAEA